MPWILLTPGGITIKRSDARPGAPNLPNTHVDVTYIHVFMNASGVEVARDTYTEVPQAGVTADVLARQARQRRDALTAQRTLLAQLTAGAYDTATLAALIDPPPPVPVDPPPIDATKAGLADDAGFWFASVSWGTSGEAAPQAARQRLRDAAQDPALRSYVLSLMR